MADWQRIETAYREGTCWVRELARQEGVTEGAIRKRARAKGWPARGTQPVVAISGAIRAREGSASCDLNAAMIFAVRVTRTGRRLSENREGQTNLSLKLLRDFAPY